MVTPLNTLKNWFVTKAMPLQEQFWNWLDSFRHMSVKINMTDLDTDVLTALAAGGSVTDTVTEFVVLGVFDAPPLSVFNGGAYGVGTNPVDEFANHENQIAIWNNSTGWSFIAPVLGNYRYNTIDATTAIFQGNGTWYTANGLPVLNQGNDISSGVTIGTKNNAGLDFKTNNTRRGGFDALGNFDIAALAGNGATLMLVILPNGKVAAQAIPGGGSGGQNGVSITGATIDNNGHLIVSYSNGTTSDAGNVVGAQGAQGSQGVQGVAGKGISSTVINGSNHLIITYTDGTSFDLGVVVGSNGAAGAAGRGITNTAIDGSGHLIITYSDGTSVDVGTVKGTNGTNGTNGSNGRGVTSITINGSNHLIVTYTDTTTQDAGAIPGSTENEDFKIYKDTVTGIRYKFQMVNGDLISTAI